VLTNINSPVHQVGQGVDHTDLQTLLLDLSDVHRPSPKIKEVIKFMKGLSVEESLENFYIV
jgi:hypothetical protein